MWRFMRWRRMRLRMRRWKMKREGSDGCCGGNNILALSVVIAVLFAVAAYALLQPSETPPAEGVQSPPNAVVASDSGGGGLLQVVVYSDFKCPYCARAATTVNQIREEYEGRIEVVFRQFPLSFHRGADKAAEAAECARDQGMFWEYHDMLFERHGSGYDVGDSDVLKSIASDLGLARLQFNRCLDSSSKESLVESHISEGRSRGVSGTPTFFIGGQKVVGAQPMSAFREVIGSELGGAGG
ncbi:MAG: thioredoxin domain-containing protein [Candidatus Altiarchaeales archaeon]|nr:thioredoxin domain-containing protein [Candidatus Altiarchaeales archaeon]MBD3416413.1 thioredoxin domain-containing protein [Candidatus Altiarchaeales archaeon]